MQTTQVTQHKSGFIQAKLAYIANEIRLMPLVREACDFGHDQGDKLNRSIVSEHDVRIAIRSHVRAASDKNALTMADRVRLTMVAHFAAGIAE